VAVVAIVNKQPATPVTIQEINMTRVYQQPIAEGFVRSVGNGDISYDVVPLRAADGTRDEALGLDPIVAYAPGTVVVYSPFDGKYEPLVGAHLVAPVDPKTLTYAIVARRAEPGPAIAITRLAVVNAKDLIFVTADAGAGGSATLSQIADALALKHIVAR
jgi:hypothetical protein